MLRENEQLGFVDYCRRLTHPHASTLLENRLQEFEAFIFREHVETNKPNSGLNDDGSDRV
jgi:hypothetical protein